MNRSRMTVMKATKLPHLILTFLLAYVCYPTQSSAGRLDINSLEFRQLTAMGYDLAELSNSNENFNVISNGDQKLVVEKLKDRMIISTIFTRKRLNAQDEAKLLRIVNRYNIDSIYSVSAADTSITFSVIVYGTYNSRALSAAIRFIEQVDHQVSTDKELLALVND